MPFVMRAFSKFIKELELVSPLIRCGYTQGAGAKGLSFSKDWEDHFYSISLVILPRLVSNHSPILLDWG